MLYVCYLRNEINMWDCMVQGCGVGTRTQCIIQYSWDGLGQQALIPSTTCTVVQLQCMGMTRDTVCHIMVQWDRNNMRQYSTRNDKRYYSVSCHFYPNCTPDRFIIMVPNYKMCSLNSHFQAFLHISYACSYMMSMYLYESPAVLGAPRGHGKDSSWARPSAFIW